MLCFAVWQLQYGFVYFEQPSPGEKGIFPPRYHLSSPRRIEKKISTRLRLHPSAHESPFEPPAPDNPPANPPAPIVVNTNDVIHPIPLSDPRARSPPALAAFDHSAHSAGFRLLQDGRAPHRTAAGGDHGGDGSGDAIIGYRLRNFLWPGCP